MNSRDIATGLHQVLECAGLACSGLFALPDAMQRFYSDPIAQRQILTVFRQWETSTPVHERDIKWLKLNAALADFDQSLGLILYGSKYASLAGNTISVSMLKTMCDLGDPIDSIEATDLLLEAFASGVYIDDLLREEVGYYIEAYARLVDGSRWLHLLDQIPVMSWLRFFHEAGVRTSKDAIATRLAMRCLRVQERFPFIAHPANESAFSRGAGTTTDSMSWQIAELLVPEGQSEFEPLAASEPGPWLVNLR